MLLLSLSKWTAEHHLQKPHYPDLAEDPWDVLSFMCSKNSLESDGPTQVYSKKRRKPLIPALRQNLKRSSLSSESQKKKKESSDPLASPSVINTQSENISSSSTQVFCDQPLLKEGHKSGQKQAPEGKPTTVSEYFFNDIFSLKWMKQNKTIFCLFLF